MDKMVARNVTLYPDDWKVVQRKAREIGDKNNSSAGLRAIIAEWSDLRRLLADRLGNQGHDQATKGAA